MSDDPQESLDLFDEHEEIVSEDGKKVKRKGIFLLPNLLTTAALFAMKILYTQAWLFLLHRCLMG